MTNFTTITSQLPKLAHTVLKITFSWYDYVFFFVMLALSTAIGIYFGCFGKQQSKKDYLLGGKTMKVFPIAVSLVASHVSGVTLLAVPADVYMFGFSYSLLVLSIIFVVLASNYVYLPVFYKLEITSTYEYLERRFDKKTRMFASFLFALSIFLYLPIVIYIPALAISAATGINVHFITPLICGVCIFYTTIGGLKAVVWTDTLQFIVTLGALATVFILGINSAGGVAQIFRTSLEGQRLDVDFDPDPTVRDTFWSIFIGMIAMGMSSISTNQGFVQKFLSVGSLREVKQAVVACCIGLALVSVICVSMGLIMYAKYATCDPFTTKAILKSDQLLPHFIMDVAGHIPGLPGLFMAGVTCAALSTLSATLNCLAGTIYEDFISKMLKKPTETTTNHLLKLIVVIIGVICTLMVFIVEKIGSLLPLVMSLGGVTSGPLLGMFTIGVLFPKGNSKGAFYGSIIGLIFISGIVFPSQYLKIQKAIVYEPKPTSIEGCNFLTNSSEFENYTKSFENLLPTTIPVLLENLNISTVSETTLRSLNVTGAHDSTSNTTPFIFRISYYYYTLIGTVVTIIASLIISYSTIDENHSVDKDLLSPVIYSFLSDECIDRKYVYSPVNVVMKEMEKTKS